MPTITKIIFWENHAQSSQNDSQEPKKETCAVWRHRSRDTASWPAIDRLGGGGGLGGGVGAEKGYFLYDNFKKLVDGIVLENKRFRWCYCKRPIRQFYSPITFKQVGFKIKKSTKVGKRFERYTVLYAYFNEIQSFLWIFKCLEISVHHLQIFWRLGSPRHALSS